MSCLGAGLRVVAIVLVVGQGAACSGRGGSDDPWAGVSAALQARAKRVYSVRCASCHGENGAGNGPEAKKINPPPRSFRDATWQAKITNTVIERSILGGGAATGKSVVMPPNPDLQSQPALVAALRAYVRSLGPRR